MEGKVTLNEKEQRRVMVLNEVEKGVITGRQAAGLMDLSLRHVRRLLAGYRKEGISALAHGNRGKKPPNTIDEGLKQQVIKLASTKYSGFNHQHFTELLAEREGIFVSRSSVRNVLLESGIKSPRKRRPPKHRSRRERYPQEGMLLQIDGSLHDWLEGRSPHLTLIGAIDDATGKVPYALFREEEDRQGYFLLLREIVLSYGIPLALYHDRHSIFEVAENKLPSIEEQLEGKEPLTQFGRLMEELVSSIISRLSHLTAFARICSAVFVHTKGLAPSFHLERKALIAPIRQATLSKLPLRIAWLVSMPNQISTIFIHEAPVGVK